MKRFLFVTILTMLILPLEACDKEEPIPPTDDSHITFTANDKNNAIDKYTLELKDTFDNLHYTATKVLEIDGNKETTTYIRKGSNYQVTSDKETKYAYTPDFHYSFWAIKDNSKGTGIYGKSIKKYDEISNLYKTNFDIYQNFENDETTYLLSYTKDTDFDAEPITSNAKMYFEIKENDNNKLKIECIFDNDLLKLFKYEYTHLDASNKEVANEKCSIEVEYHANTNFELELPDFANWEEIEE